MKPFKCPRCPICGETQWMIVDGDALNKWVTGTVIQKAFPDYSTDQREMMQTGLHPVCWDVLHGEPA